MTPISFKKTIFIVSLLIVIGGSYPRTVGAQQQDHLPHYDDFQKFTREGCPQHTVPGSELPPVPVSFVTGLEISYVVTGAGHKVVNGMEMFDGVANRGVLDYELAEGLHEGHPTVVAEQMHYDIQADEALFVLTDATCEETGAGDCNEERRYCLGGKIDDLAYEIQQLFGIVQVPGVSGFFGASGILQFGPMFNYTKTMEMKCRGARCDLYQTCLEKPKENATVLYTYAWTTADWTTEGYDVSVPMYVTIYSKGKFDGHTTREVTMRVDFFDFQPQVKPSHFALETPAGVYCLNRTAGDGPPSLPPFFRYSAEHVVGIDREVPDGDDQYHTLKIRAAINTEEYYDSVANLSGINHLTMTEDERTRYDYRESTVNDFNSGVSYHLYPAQQFCNLSLIRNTSWGAVHSEGGVVTMATPQQLADATLPYQYSGRHWTRNMETDAWVGVIYNEEFSMNETLVWHYSTPNRSVLSGIMTVNGSGVAVPVMIERYLTERADIPHAVVNIFDFDGWVPHAHRHDVSLCFTSGQMKHLKISYPKDTLDRLDNMRQSFLYAVMLSLAEAGNVSPIRINRIEVSAVAPTVDVLFTVLAAPELAGASANHEADLNTAVNNIKDAVNNNRLVSAVNLRYINGTTVTVKVSANSKSVTEVDRSDGHVAGHIGTEGYSAGSMTGLAFGMTFVGICAAIVGIAFFEKRKLRL